MSPVTNHTPDLAPLLAPPESMRRFARRVQRELNALTGPFAPETLVIACEEHAFDGWDIATVRFVDADELEQVMQDPESLVMEKVPALFAKELHDELGATPGSLVTLHCLELHHVGPSAPWSMEGAQHSFPIVCRAVIWGRQPVPDDEESD